MSSAKTRSSHASTSTDTVASTATPAQMPPSVTVPKPPTEFDPNVTIDYRSAQPRAAELASVSGAAKEVGAFPDWVAVFGTTAPPATQVAQALQAAAAWSSLLAATTLWSIYVRVQTAIAWKDARGLVEGLKAPFALASSANPALSSANPSLARMLGTAKAIATKAAATKKANAKAHAAGEPETHGKVGKARTKKAAAAALAAATSAPTPAPVAPPPVESPAPAAAPVTSAAPHA